MSSATDEAKHRAGRAKKAGVLLRGLAPKKLSWKLTLSYAAVFTAVTVALNAGTLFGVRYFLRSQAAAEVRTCTSAVLSRTVSASGGAQLTDPALLTPAAAARELAIVLCDASGTRIAESGSEDIPLPGASSSDGKTFLYEKKDSHYVVQNSRIVSKGAVAGYLQVAYDMRSEYRFIRLLFVFMAAADAAGLIIAVLTGIWLSKRTLRPIDDMTRTARRISGGDLGGRVATGGADDEMSRLAFTFNEMLDRIQSSFEKERRFVSDASHELRTPIAVIRGYAELIDKWGRDEPAVLDESVKAIRGEADAMKELVERLLFLARGDAGRLELHIESFDAGDMLREVAEESRLISPERRIEVRAAGKIPLQADRDMIKQAVRALVDNSLKNTLPGGLITLEALQNAKGTVIAVADNGFGIPAEYLPKIFDRFSRASADRSREKGGSGLGLSIVKAIAAAHGWQVLAQSEQGKGTRISLIAESTPPARG
jgi:two-component system sensor histidine kinase ArlS